MLPRGVSGLADSLWLRVRASGLTGAFASCTTALDSEASLGCRLQADDCLSGGQCNRTEHCQQATSAFGRSNGAGGLSAVEDQGTRADLGLRFLHGSMLRCQAARPVQQKSMLASLSREVATARLQSLAFCPKESHCRLPHRRPASEHQG